MRIWIMTAFNDDASADQIVFAPTKAKAMDAARVAAGGDLRSPYPDFSYTIRQIDVAAGREGICQVVNDYIGATD